MRSFTNFIWNHVCLTIMEFDGSLTRFLSTISKIKAYVLLNAYFISYTFKLFSPMWANITYVSFLIHFFGSGGIKPLYWGPSGKGWRAGRTMRSDIFHPARISATSQPPKSLSNNSFLRFPLCEILNCLNFKIKSLQLYTNNKTIIL